MESTEHGSTGPSDPAIGVGDVSGVRVPEDFPRNPFPAALPGAQLKFVARQIDGRYVVGLTQEERRERYLACVDLTDQLIPYVERKRQQFPSVTLPALLDEIDTKVRRQGWDFGATEFDWVMAQLRARFL